MTDTAILPPLGALGGAKSQPSLPSLVEHEHRSRWVRRATALAFALAVPAAGAALYARVRARPVPVSARFRSEPVSRGDVLREARATGRLEAESTVLVGAEISGRIESVEADFNAHVRRGQVLARFDRASLLAQVAQLEASLGAARASLATAQNDRAQAAANFSRAERLYGAQVATEQEFDGASYASRGAQGRALVAAAQVSVQAAALNVARTNLQHAVVRAPIDGVVITRNVDPGQTVVSALQTPVLFSVAADLARMRVVAAVDEADVGNVSAGQQVEFTVSAFPGRTFRGAVSEVRNAPVVAQDVVTYGALVEVSNDDHALRPGMTAAVRVRTGTALGALRVPNAALRFTPPGRSACAGPCVWVLESDGPRPIAVRPGLADDAWTAVEPGPLAEGRRVLTELTPQGRAAYGIAH